jgi:hypothetical protein
LAYLILEAKAHDLPIFKLETQESPGIIQSKVQVLRPENWGKEERVG